MTRKRGARSSQGQEQGKTSKSAATPLWEAAVGALGLLFVLATIGFLAHQAVTKDARTPSISIKVVAVTPSEGGYHVRFRATNSGDATAAALRIKGELRRGSDIIEDRYAILDYLPASGTREGGLVFQQNPESYELRLVPEGYADP